MSDLAHLDAATRASLACFIPAARARLPVVEIRLYGSRARGDGHDDSDVDVAVIYDDPTRRVFQVINELSWITTDILLDHGRVLSLLPIPALLWIAPEHHANPFLLAQIKRDGVTL